jgi:hypothetical protein
VGLLTHCSMQEGLVQAIRCAAQERNSPAMTVYVVFISFLVWGLDLVHMVVELKSVA